jgi:CBS domain-containing protein
VYRVFPDTPVSELLELMGQHELKAVPVVGEKREVLGIVTDRDLLRFLLPQLSQGAAGERPVAPPQERSPRDTPVREIMSRSVMCISEEQGLAELAAIMVNKDVERLPVVSDGQLTGFLTRGDILRKLFGR